MLLCKKCHGEFDPEAELSRVLSGNEEVFWICIFANDIGAPPKPGRDKALHLEVETVSRWSIEDLPVRYGHTSEPIGRVLFGWHIHWDDKPTFACASLSTIKKVPFEAAAPFLLTAACQASLGTVNGVPDEISITILGARDDTVGLFCSRDGLRELLTRFKFFDAATVEPIKRNCCRASNFRRSLMDAMSTATTPIVEQQPQPLPAMSTAVPTTVSSTPEPILQAKGNEDEEPILKVEDLAQQICELREKFENQNETMDLIRGLMEEWSVKAVEELKATEAPGTTKIRNDLDRMVAAGIIRMPDDAKQPKVDDGEAIRRMVEFNMHQFPVTLAKSFRDTVQNILEPTEQSSSSDPVERRNDGTLPSIGTSLVAVRATALRAIANRQANSTLRASVTRPKLPPEKEMTPLQQIHHALSKNLAPRRRRHRPTTSNECDDDFNDMTPSKFQKLVRETVRDTMQDYTVTRKQKSREEMKEEEEEETKSAFFEAFEQFLASKQRLQSQQPQQQQQQQQQHNLVPTAQPQVHPRQQHQQQQLQLQQIRPDASTSNPIPSSSNTTVRVPEPTSQTLQPQSVVRASGLSIPTTPATESTTPTLADLNIFY